ncbi:uncharacterized protein LOC124119811 isoform X1 [Haliotis rufescens]|uniref:uncharacterized protein LOC124119811 isoform X1 n=2 Tax=Haliotis rufescens TaxID=6454 RepID=UPI00201F2907|nr:uncharacterized protein LOC124119811 isoform X1 [Haliotis rufescens]
MVASDVAGNSRSCDEGPSQITSSIMSGVTPEGPDKLSKTDPDAVLAMDLEYTINKRNEKCVSPFPNSSNKSVKSRMSVKKEGTSSSLKTRARQIKAHEPEPFLSVDTLPDDKRNLSTEGSARHDRQSVARRQSTTWAKPVTPIGQRGMSRFSMYSSASVPARHTLTRSSRSGVATSMSHRTMPAANNKVRTSNSHIKMPFKHSVHKPVVPVPPESGSPSQELKDRTALATYHINKMLQLDTQGSEHRPRGKLLKAKLKPLYPVKVQGPHIEHCRGIVADTHSYSASPSKSLQRRKQIMSSMNAGELKDLMDRPRTVESIHRTSVASSVDDNRDNLLEEDIRQLTHGVPQASSSSTSSLPSVMTVPSQTQQGISEVTQPSDLSSASPILSPEASETQLRGSSRDSGRDSSTVFLTSGRSVEALTDDPVLGEVIPPEVETASREVIEMVEMLEKRISLLGNDTKDLMEAKGRDDDMEAEKCTGGACDKMTDVMADTAQEEHQSGNSSVEGRVRPYSATTQLTHNFRPTGTRPLSTGDLSRRKSTNKSVRFADEAESPTVEAWNNAMVDKDSNNNAYESEGNMHSSSNNSKSRCKPSEIELSKEPEDPDDDKENYSPKKSVYFPSSQTFSQTLASTTTQQCIPNKTPDKTTRDATEAATRTSFMEEFLAHAAPVDDSVCSVSSEEPLYDAVQKERRTCEDKEKGTRPFPLVSLSERIAAANIYMTKSSCESMPVIELDKVRTEDEDEEDIEVILVSDPPLDEKFMESDPSVNVTFSSHDMLNQFEHCYGSVNNLIEKPPVTNRRKKTKGRATTASESKKRPTSPPRPGSPGRTQRKESNSSSRGGRGKRSDSPSKPSSYRVGARHHYPSDLIDSGVDAASDKPICKTNFQGQGKSRSTRIRPNSGHSVSSYSSQTSSTSSGRLKNNVPNLKLKNPNESHVDEEIEALTFDDLDHQIDLIQSELKKNIDQQAQLLSETEHLRHSLKSREDLYPGPDKADDKDGGSVWCPASSLGLQSDGYYQSLLTAYRKKCMDMSENCLMISEHITTPRWQVADTGSGGTGSEEKAAETPESISQNTEEKVLHTEDSSTTDRRDGSEESPEHDTGCEGLTEISDKEDEAGAPPEKADSFLRMLCTTVEEVEQPIVKPTCLEIGQDPISTTKDLKVVATTKELSKQKVKTAEKPSAPFPPLCFAINARPPQGCLYYFAYGADMNTDRMSLYLKRDVSQRFWGLLMGFSLVFNKKGADVEAGGFPNIEFNPFCSVEGCVYQLTPGDLSVLDKCVGVPQHYCHVVLPVWMSNTTDPDKLGVAQYCVPATIYIAQDEWVDRDGGLSTEYSISQCSKSADLLTPAYRAHLAKMATVSAPVLQPATA